MVLNMALHTASKETTRSAAEFTGHGPCIRCLAIVWTRAHQGAWGQPSVGTRCSDLGGGNGSTPTHKSPYSRKASGLDLRFISVGKTWLSPSILFDLGREDA